MEPTTGHPTAERWRRHIVVDATLEHPLDAVFPYLCDPTRWHDFAPAVAYRERLDTGPIEVGSRWKATDRVGPFHIHFIDELDYLDDRRVVWLSSAPWNSCVEYACEEVGTGTRVRADYVGVLSGTMRWQAGWLPIWGWWVILSRDFRRLNRLLTRRTRAAERWTREKRDDPAIA